jgi:hypothetical protein
MTRKLVIAAAISAAISVWLMSGIFAQDYPNCSGWISQSCCCTNECCFEVEPGTVQALDVDLSEFRVVASGQIVKRTGWSKDGRFMRCACDRDDATGKWVKSPKANTRCIFPIPPSF